MKSSSAAAIALVLVVSQFPSRADLAPEVAERLRASVVMIETSEGSMGTGFFVGENGLLLTNAHVLDTDSGRVDVRFLDETEGVAELVSFDPAGFDIAALRLVDGKPPASLELTPDAGPRPGQRVYQAGNPYELFPSLMSTGIVGHHRATHHIFVHDAAASSGSSGSPVVDAAGRLLGITVSLATDDAGDPENSYSTGFTSAIDVAAIRAFLDRLAKGERSDVKTGHVEYLRYPLPALEPGQAVDGKLTHKSDRNPGDLSYSDGYLIDLEKGEVLLLTLVSEDFDAYLLLYDNDASVVADNDDAPGEGVTDSEILFEVPESGRYVVVATSLDRGETGDYRLLGETLRFAEPDVRKGKFAAGDPQRNGGPPYHKHIIEGQPGRWLSVTMRSEEVDSMLRLIGPDGSEIANNDDWNEDTLDSRIVRRINRKGEYQIIATSVGDEDATGPFELEIMWSEN